MLIYFFVDCLRLVDYVRLELKGEILTRLNQRLVTQTMDNDSNDDTLNYETTLSECLEQSCERLIASISSIMDLIVQKIQVRCEILCIKIKSCYFYKHELNFSTIHIFIVLIYVYIINNV